MGLMQTCDKERFLEACRLVAAGGRLKSGIGTMGESSVHAVLKNYFEPYQDSQELKIGGFVADIVGEDGIIEIQTGHFSALKGKLAAFLPAAAVTVVYPVYVKKRIVTVDGEGVLGKPRTSPLKESPYEIFREIFPIAEFLTNPSLRFAVMSLECEEYRIDPQLIGKKKNRRGRLSVMDRMPTALVSEIRINSPEDWKQLIPCLYEKDFTAADLAEKAHIPLPTAQMAVSALFRGKVLARTGKRGRAYTYGTVTGC
ncbi:MAG: hypothetical protein NC078_10755 [Ruminococcus sp.]|nr:hypothetical protein [Ruminococcus sp.]